MAIDDAEKRKSISGIQVSLISGVTPNASKDIEWRQQSGWGYSGIAAAEALLGNFMRSMRMAIEYEGVLEDVTPDDANDLTQIGILYVGGAGNIKVDGAGGGTGITLVGVPAGTWLNFIRVKRVYLTGTTATNIVLAR